MSTRARWLLVINLGLMVHLFLVTQQVAALSPFYNNPGVKHGVPPFGQVNYRTASDIAFIEWLLLLILWIAFAVVLLRRSGE